MLSIHFLLLIVAFLCFVLAAMGIPSRIGLLPLGMAFWVLSLLVV